MEPDNNGGREKLIFLPQVSGNRTGYNGGGAFYIQTNGVTVVGCAFTENTATNNGGAIQLQSATNTNIDLNVSDTDFVRNSANYGGAICTVQTNNGSSAAKLTLPAVSAMDLTGYTYIYPTKTRWRIVIWCLTCQRRKQYK